MLTSASRGHSPLSENKQKSRLTPTVINVLCAVTGLLATYLLVGFQKLDFNQPITLSGDHTFMLGVIKDAINGVGRFNEQLGAPGQKDAYFFPLFDGSYKALSWLTSRFSSDLFVAANWFYFCAVTLMFGASFTCMRKLNVPALLAAIASVAFVLTPFFFVRVSGHDYLSLYFSVPFGATLPLLLAKSVNNKELVRTAKTPFAILALIFVGTSGFYYGFFGCLFLGLVLPARSFNQRRLMPLLVYAAMCTVVIALLMFSAYGFYVFGLLDGSVPRPPERSSLQQFYHGLEIGGALQAFSDIGLFAKPYAQYLEFSTSTSGLSQLAGEGNFPEWPGAFLTSLILAAPIFVFMSMLSTAQRTVRSLTIALCFGFITFGLVFATRGGLGFIFNSMIIPAVRAQARIMPFLMFFAIVAICLSVQNVKTAMNRWIATALVSLGLLSGMLSAFNGLPRKQMSYLIDPTQQAYRQSVTAMLEAKDRAGLGQILQLPIMVWPEASPRQQLLGYEHVLPYLLDKPGSVTRWSYGLANGQQVFAELEILQRDVRAIPAAAKALKFDGILVEKTGYTSEQLAILLAALQANGVCSTFDDSYRALFRMCR